MSYRSARRSVPPLLVLFGLVGLFVSMVGNAQASGTASAASVAPTHIKRESAPVAAIRVSMSAAAGETLTNFVVRLSPVGTGFSSGDLRPKTDAGGCATPDVPAGGGNTWCDGVQLWLDGGTENGGTPDVFDATDTPVSESFDTPGGNDCSATFCDVDLVMTGGDTPFPLPATSTLFVVVRTSLSIENADAFTVSLQPTAITTSPVATLCCNPPNPSATITADTIAPVIDTVAPLGLSRAAGVVHQGSDTDFTGESTNAVLQVYSSGSDTCSPRSFVAQSSSTDLRVNHTDIPGFDAAALRAFPVGQFVCYQIKDRAENLSSVVADGTMPGSPSAGDVALLTASNVTGAKQVSASPDSASRRFRMYVKPGNAGDFLRARDQNTLVHDNWVEIVTLTTGPTCSVTAGNPPGNTNCTTDIRQYQSDTQAGPTLAAGDGVGYSLANANGNDGDVVADGTVPAAPADAERALLRATAAAGHQRLVHAGGTPGQTFGLYMDASGLGTTYARAVDQTGAFVQVTSAAGEAHSGTSEIHEATGTGPQLASGDNIGYVAVGSGGNISALTTEGTVPAAPSVADTTFSDALNQFRWNPAVPPSDTHVRLFAGSTATAAYAGGILGTAENTSPVTIGSEQPDGLGLFYSAINPSTGHESPLTADGSIPAAPDAGDAGLLGTSAASGHQRIVSQGDASPGRVFRLYADPSGGTSWTRATTTSGGSTPIEVTTAAGQADSCATDANCSVFAGTTQLAGAHRVGYARVVGGNDSDVTADGVIPASPDATHGLVSDAVNKFIFSSATATNRARVHFGGSGQIADLAYSEAGPDAEATSASPVDVAEQAANNVVFYTLLDNASGNESATVADGSIPAAPTTESSFLSVSAAQQNQRLVATADSQQPRIFGLFVDPAGGTAWERGVTTSNGATPVRVTTASATRSSDTVDVFAGATQLTTGHAVGYARVDGNDHESDVLAEGSIPGSHPIADTRALGPVNEVEVLNIPASTRVNIFASSSGDMNFVYDEGADGTIDGTDPDGRVSVPLGGGFSVFYTRTNTTTGHEGPIVADGTVPQAIAAATTQASDALDQFVVPGASAASPVVIILDTSSDAATAWRTPDSRWEATTSPFSPGSELDAKFVYYTVKNAASGNESPITSVESIPAAPADLPGIMSASAAQQAITSSQDTAARVVRLYVDADGAGALGFARATKSSGGTDLVQLTTSTGGEVSSSPAGVFVGATPLGVDMGIAYARVLGPSNQNDSDLVFDGAIPAAPLADHFTADASAGSATIGAPAVTGTYRVFKNAIPASARRAHTSGVATVVALSSPLAGGDTVGYALSNADNNESPVFADGTIPTVSTPDLQAASDTGHSDTDNVTKITAPVFDVTSVGGALVQLMESGTERGSATANGAGLATITSAALGNGVHPMTAKATLNGNTSPLSAPLSVTVDTVVPAAPTAAPDLDASSDSGSSNTDDLTNDPTPTLNVVGDPNGVVTIKEGATALGTGQTDGSGNGQVVTNVLADGAHVLFATTTDGAGNESAASPTRTITIDTVAPAVPGVPDMQAASDSNIDTDNVTNDATPTFDVAGLDANSIVTVFYGATAVSPTANSGSGSTASVTPGAAIPDGDHGITATATDAAGNASAASGALDATIDTVAPSKPAAPDLVAASDSGASNSDDITNDTTPTFSVSGHEFPATVRLREGSDVRDTQQTDSAGAANLTSTALADGAHAFTVTSADLAGNVSEASDALSVTIDATAPPAPASAPDLLASSDSGASSTDDVTNDATPTFSTTGAEPSSTAWLLVDGVNIASAPADGSGNAEITSLTIPDGAHSVASASTDPAGNTSPASPALPVTIDTVKPGTPVLDLLASSDLGRSSTDDVTNDATPDVGLSGTESGAALRLLAGGTQVGSGTAGSGGTATITSSTLADGAHSLTAEATDLAGNTADAGSALAVTIDTVKPATPAAPDLDAGSDSGASNSDDVTNDNTPTLNVTTEPNALVTAIESGTALGTAIANGSGAAAVTTGGLVEGAHPIAVTASDVAGNVSDASSTLTVTIDTVKPGTPSLDLTAASDTGRSNTDDVTKDSTPTFAITGTEAGAALRILEGTTALGTGTADGSGAASLTTGTIADGSHPVRAEASDLAGNVGDLSNTITLVVDTAKPAKPAKPDLAAASDSGASSTDDITSDATPTFAVASEPNASMTLSHGGAVLGSTITDGSGNGTITTGALSDGVRPITLVSTDAAGNLSDTSDALILTVDTTAPAATLANAASIGGASTAQFTEHVTPFGAAQLQIRIDGTSSVVPSRVTYSSFSKKAWITPAPNLMPGQYYELVLVPSGATVPTDLAGNPLAPQVRDFRASLVEQEWSTAVSQGWRVVGTPAAYGGSYATERLSGARVSMRFSGTQITWYTVVGPDQGLAQVLIDGRNMGVFDNYGSRTVHRIGRTFGGLSGSHTHTITVISTGRRGSRASDSKVAVDAFRIRFPNGREATIVSPGLTYAWRIIGDSRANGGRYVVADQPGSAVSFTFRGTRVAWFPVLGPNMGLAQVYIDGVNKGTVDLYSARDRFDDLRFFSGLRDGVHTIRIVALGRRNARSGGTVVSVDRFAIG